MYEDVGENDDQRGDNERRSCIDHAKRRTFRNFMGHTVPQKEKAGEYRGREKASDHTPVWVEVRDA